MIKSRLIVEGYKSLALTSHENLFEFSHGAIENRVDGLNIDLWLTTDDVPVIITAVNNSGLVKLWNLHTNKYTALFIYKVSFSELSDYRLADKITPVPTLIDFLQGFGQQNEMYLCFNIKQNSDKLVKNLFVNLRECGVKAPVEISSYFFELKHVIDYWSMMLGVSHISFCVNLRDFCLLTDQRFLTDMKTSNNNICFDLGVLLSYPEETKELAIELKNLGKKVKCQSSVYFRDLESPELYRKILESGCDTLISCDFMRLIKYNLEESVN